jgi:hypothetical protein
MRCLPRPAIMVAGRQRSWLVDRAAGCRLERLLESAGVWGFDGVYRGGPWSRYEAMRPDSVRISRATWWWT